MEAEAISKGTACERCHRRKARCDRVQPVCSSCAKAATSCNYSFRDSGLRRHDTEQLQRRLRQAEIKNQALSAQLREAQGRVSLDRASGVLQGVPENCSNIDANRTSNDNNNNNNEIARQVSCLSLNMGGDQQFLGSASGLLLGNLLQVHPRDSPQVAREDDFYAASRRFGSGHLLKSGDTTMPKATILPPEKLARSLFSAYLEHDHLCYPFIHPPSLMQAIDAVYSNDDFYANHPVEAFMIDMVFAVATAQVCKFDWQVLPDAETHYDRAMSGLPNVLSNSGIVALQAILLVCQYRMLSAAHETSASLWRMIGMAARICFELGLHRESTYLATENGNSQPSGNLNEVSEIKRRCFWCVFAMDRIASVTLGRPVAINPDDVDTELPYVGAISTTSPDRPLSLGDAYDSPQWWSRTAIFVHIVRYRAICGKILTSLHNTVRRKAHVDYNTVRQELAQELADWRRGTASLPLVDATPASDENRSSFRSHDWYNLLYQNGILMLYRPLSTLQNLQDSEILQQIFHAAQQSITVYSYLHRSRKINYSWITLHAVFIAGLSYVYTIRVHFQTRRRQLKVGTNFEAEQRAHLVADPTINQIFNDTRACLTVLVAVSERWNAARDCHLVFGRLSDAVLADVVEFYTQPVPPAYPTTAYPAGPPAMSLGQYYSQSSELHQAAGANSLSQPPMFAASLDITNSYQDCFHGLDQHWFGDISNDATMQAPQEWLFEIQALDEM